MDPHETSSGSHRIASLIGIIGTLLIFFFIILVMWVPNRPDPALAVRVQERKQIREEATNAGVELTTTYGVVDAAKGVYRIPVDRAMDLTLAELRAAQAE